MAVEPGPEPAEGNTMDVEPGPDAMDITEKKDGGVLKEVKSYFSVFFSFFLLKVNNQTFSKSAPVAYC